MKATVIAFSSLAMVFWAVLPAGAQQDSTPYQGVVTGDEVYVRSGPNMGSYPVTKLSAPARVTVVEKLSDDWLAIRSVCGCYGVVSAQYVQPDATGKIGTITGDGVLVRAAGDLRQKNFDNPLGKRNRGDRVRIVGRVRNKERKIIWYVIKPPSDMRFYISAKFVRSADAKVAEAPPSSEKSPATPAAPPVISPTPSPVPHAVGAPVRQELKALRAIRALEKELVAETAKPVEKRNFADILTRAEKIKLPKNSRFTPIYDSLLQYLREEKALVESTRATDRMVDEVLRKAAEKRKGAVRQIEPAPTPTPAGTERPYDLEGILTLSALYTLADPNQPKRYVVRHPQTKSVIGYAQSSTGKLNLEDYEGKNVGLRGRKRYDETISMKILEVDSVTPLDGSVVPKKPEPAEPKPAEPTPPTPTEPETEKPAEPEAEKPVEPAEPWERPKPAAPVEPEPADVEPVEPVEAKPAQPVEEPRPLEQTEPLPAVEEPSELVEPEPADAEPLEPLDAEPLEPLEPLDTEPLEPIKAEPATPVKEPEPQTPEPAEPAPAVAEPLEPVKAEPATPVKEPEPQTPEPAEPMEPKPVQKKPTPPKPADVKPAEPAPAKPRKVDPAKIQPMKIKPADVKPADIESPAVQKLPVKSPPPSVKPAELEPIPTMPGSETGSEMFEVEATERDVEVEWD